MILVSFLLFLLRSPVMSRTKVAAQSSPPSSTPRKSRRSWAPDKDDHYIYWCVKFGGLTQAWVANEMGVSQGTISRTIQRYERWQSRIEAAADGRLSHAERLRAQRWLTFERNEIIVASCLRIAEKMEGFIDVSKSTFVRPLARSEYGEQEVRTEHSTLDRTGIAARYLRLAFRVNMEQLELAEREELPPLAALSGEELATEEEAAEALRQALRAARHQRGLPIDEAQAEAQPIPAIEARAESRRQQADEAERIRAIQQVLGRV